MNNHKTKDINNHEGMACTTERPMPAETPSRLDDVRNFSLSPPPPPGGYDAREIANCAFPEFVPSQPHGNGQFPVHCILDKNLPARRQKTIQPPKLDSSELQNNPKLFLPDLGRSPSLTKATPTLHIRPRGGMPLSGNEAGDPMELMKAFVKKTYDHHNVWDHATKTGISAPKKERKEADRPHELTEVFLKKSVPHAARIAEVQNKLGEHLNIGRSIGAADRKKRQVRRSYAAMGA